MNIPSLMCDGDPNAPLCIIGMAPGKEELVEGRPFVGASGILLWSLAKRAGFSRADCYILNTIAEWPMGKKGEPTPEQLDRYWDFFDAALSKFTGSCILLLGKDAMIRTIGVDGIMGWRGYLMPRETWQLTTRHQQLITHYKTNTKLHKKGDPKVSKILAKNAPVVPKSVIYCIPAMHPAAVIRTGFKQVPVLAYDVDRAWRSSQNALVQYDFSYDSSTSNLTGDHDAIAVDIETDFSPGGGTGIITRVGVANSAGRWSVPWGAGTKENLIRELSGIHDRFAIFHNACFDVPELERHGVPVKGKIFDTMLACQLLQPDIFKGLNGVSSMYLDVKRWKHLSKSQPEMYNAHDVIATYYLYIILTEALKQKGVYKHFTECIMPALRVLMDMEREGLRLDTGAAESWRQKLIGEIDAVRTEFQQLYPGISISSPAQISHHVWQVLGPVHKFRSYGKKTSVDEATLTRLGRGHPDIPLFRLVLKYRELNEYYKRFTKLAPDTKNLIYPSYAPAAKDDEFLDYHGEAVQFAKGIAGTGRIQAKEPNPQQLPKDARSIFIPHDPDLNSFLEFDYDSAELRVCAALSRDARFLDAVNGPNLHQAHADAWGCTRDEAKTIVYATLYGATADRLMLVFAMAGQTVKREKCRDLQEKFFASYPDFTAWRNEIVRTLPKTKSLSNPFGRPRYFWNTREDTPAALDFLPQSTVADICWTVLPSVQAAARYYGGGLRTIVHDSFLLELPDTRMAEAAATIRDILEQEFPNVALGFRLPTKCKHGKSWGSLTRYTYAD